MKRMASFLQKGLRALQKWGYQRARAIPSNKAFLVQPGYRVDMGLLPSLVFWDEEQAHHVAERHRRSIENVGVRFLRPDLFDLEFKAHREGWHDIGSQSLGTYRLHASHVDTAMRWFQHEPSIENGTALLELAFFTNRKDAMDLVVHCAWAEPIPKKSLIGGHIVQSFVGSQSCKKETQRALYTEVGMLNPHCLSWVFEHHADLRDALLNEAVEWNAWAMDSQVNLAKKFWPTTLQTVLNLPVGITDPRWLQHFDWNLANSLADQLIDPNDAMFLAYSLDHRWQLDEGYHYIPSIAKYQHCLQEARIPIGDTTITERERTALKLAKEMNVEPLEFYAMLQFRMEESPEGPSTLNLPTLSL
jgi:hypothetical protein